MSGTQRRRPGRAVGERHDPDTAALVVTVAVLAVAGVVWGSWAAGTALTGGRVVWNPLAALLEVATGKRVWPTAATVILAAAMVTVVGVVTLVVVGSRGRRRGARHPIDVQARLLTPPRKLRGVTARDADRVGTRVFPPDPRDPDDAAGRGPGWRRGLHLGDAVTGNMAVFLPWQSVVAMVGGTGSGKTSAVAVPAVLDAPGAVVATSNGPDLYVDTCGARAGRGRVWLCDLQGVTGRARTEFWVDLLTQARGGVAAAKKLAGFFVAASTDKNARVDAYFDGGAQDLLALYLLAAAVGGGDVLHTAQWLGSEQDETPILLLAAHGETFAARRIREAQQITPRQRDGLYDMARRFLAVVTETRYQGLVVPPARKRFTVSGDVDRAIDGDTTAVTVEVSYAPVTHDLPEFDPVAFVTSGDTLYSLSRKGAGSTAPLTSALVGQVLEAGIAAAMARPTARLAVPMLLVLDEAANICPLPDLPDMYSWLRKHAIMPMVFLQSPSQGVEAWGETGFKAITSQSVHIYGGNVDDREYLEHWVALCGTAQIAHTSTSRGPGGATGPPPGTPNRSSTSPTSPPCRWTGP